MSTNIVEKPTKEKPISVILLAGGAGSRMNSSIPKQFLTLGEKCIARHSFDLFHQLPEIKEIVVVCDPSYREMFQSHSTIVKFALPGKRRQDSVYNGFQEIQHPNSLVCIHDSARPFITKELVRRVIEASKAHGAATAAMPIKFTVKESNALNMVANTPDRSKIWEIQTPQLIEYSLLYEGFAKCHKEQRTVTDDVSLVELLNKPVNLVEGCYTNIKITTPEDYILSQSLYTAKIQKKDE